VLLGGELADVQRATLLEVEKFPARKHQRPVFSESQFESYRAFGYHEIMTILGMLAAPQSTLPNPATD